MTDQDIADIVPAYQGGRLRRSDYWIAMQQHHLQLLEYCRLVKSANLERIEIGASELHVVLQSGLKLRWRPEDIRTVPNILINHGVYEITELDTLAYLARSCKVILDVGANIGWYSLHLAHLLRGTGAQIYAFEPVPRTFAELAYNIGLNHLDEAVHAFNLGLGESADTVRFYIPAFSGSVAASQRQLFPDDTNETIECQIVPLDSFVRQQQLERLDLIKCDVEGGELFVMRGGQETVQVHKPIIMLEMLRKWGQIFGYHPNDIIALLSRYGYRCWSCHEDGFSEIQEVSETCAQTNFFFLHDDKHAHLLAEMAAFRAGQATLSTHGDSREIRP